MWRVTPLGEKMTKFDFFFSAISTAIKPMRFIIIKDESITKLLLSVTVSA